MSAYRVAAVVVKEPEVAWADRPKAAFARGEARYARHHIHPFIGGLVLLAGGAGALFFGQRAIGAALLVVGFCVTLRFAVLLAELDERETRLYASLA